MTEVFRPHRIDAAPSPSLVGMAALAAAIVGGPLTMAFLALEVTGDLPLTSAVLAASVVSALLVRETFGYSFSTWRLHLRGETIRSAHDVGWIRNLTVGRMMRKDVQTVSADMSAHGVPRQLPAGLDPARRRRRRTTAAMPASWWWPDLYSNADGDPEGTIRPLLVQRNIVLTPEMQARKAAILFDLSQSEALAVVRAPDDWAVIGLLSEAFVLRRYAEELEKARRELAGERA